jgi:hypothetical protein
LLDWTRRLADERGDQDWDCLNIPRPYRFPWIVANQLLAGRPLNGTEIFLGRGTGDSEFVALHAKK